MCWSTVPYSISIIGNLGDFVDSKLELNTIYKTTVLEYKYQYSVSIIGNLSDIVMLCFTG
jgi:hypothetical protein